VGGILGVLLVAVLLVRWRLDSYLLERARAEADTVSQRLGRPVTIGDIDTQLLPDVGVQVSDVQVGAAGGEPEPLLTLSRLEVGVRLMPLLRSGGKDVQVTGVEARTLGLNVLRFPDGTTNVQRAAEKWAASAPPEEPTPEGEKDLSNIRVDRLALVDGTARLVDLTRPGSAPLAINDLDVEVKDLRAGEPLTATLAAGVLQPAQNLRVELTTAPLPRSLVPVPERVVLKAEPIDLAPLGPFLPPDVGLQAGRLQADWTATLGALAPGGTGPTRLQGGLQAQGLRFAGAEGGRALDVLVSTDVTGDLQVGSLALDTLQVMAGPARITGQGRVRGLLTGKPEVQDFLLVGEGLDPQALSAYYPPLKGLAQQVAGPVGLRVTGEGNAESQSLVANVDLTPVRLRIPEELSKEAGTPMKVTARLSGAAAGGGALQFDATADLTGADLRPGDNFDKKPGQRLLVRAGGTYRPGKGGEGMQVDVPRLTVDALDSTLTGSATYATQGKGKAATQTFTADLKSARLDADALLLSSDESAAFRGKTPEQADAEAAAAPPKDPDRFDGYRGTVKMEVAQLRMEETDMQDVRMEMKMVDDAVTLERLTAGVYGGTVVADGTRVELGPKERPFTFKAQVRKLNVTPLLAEFLPEKALEGLLDSDFDLTGRGFSVDSLKQNLAGGIDGTLVNGVLTKLDVLAGVTEPLARALPFAGKALKAGDVTKLGDTLPFGITFQNGVAQLKRPISWTRPEAAMSFDGGVRLDGAMDLAGQVTLPPQTVSALTLGKAAMKEPLPVALKLTGPLWKPQVSGLDVRPAVTAIAKQAAVAGATQLLGDKLGDKVGGKAGALIEGGPDAARAAAEKEAAERRAQLEARAAEERAKAEERARQEADAARRRAEEEAKKRLKGLFGGG
jgi:AsmA protein